MSQNPWLRYLVVLYKHGLDHLKLNTAFDNQIAMLSIDNFVELIIKTYLRLPRRITGRRPFSRRFFNEVNQDFPSLLRALEKFASDKTAGIDLGAIEWYHWIRNRVYHDGNGVTVENKLVEWYFEEAKELFLNLFELKEREFRQELVKAN